MASGIPVIAPDSGGMIFAAAASEIRSNPAIRIEKTRRALETAQAFRWPAITARFLQLYRELVTITHDQRASSVVTPFSWSTPGDFLGREIRIDTH
jgi:hypothetical protein